ncbi:sigma-70 family RNA polymerase sigma factor [Desulfohalobium retbaense]|jgi:RNA polymerase sigma-32 factor|uniref:RNA polymerase sigma factor n=1 Tax=Desulfohalobium retbaense (strain ATCC 49708 / DSM 5692 / JCM 16813 / HR100) TaxID=485915 RepID=C8X152_DESRD|nr:RNA polymerase factor sigma-32 [Desulfohalobium retbaense]ACV68149.1 putative RNA polymerase, sigma 70 family subunit [Desulfohalobium retbaense DSM 5692]
MKHTENKDINSMEHEHDHDIELDEPEAGETLDDSTAEEASAESLPAPAAVTEHLPSLIQPSSNDVAIQDPLKLYLREVNRFPLLEPDEEVELARRVRDENDQSAAFRLISSHLRLVVKIAMEFQRRWMKNVLDLVQEGNVGLMKAVQKFDPERGIKFSYYASFWIRAYILKFIMDNWRMVKLGTTQAQRKLFYNLSREKQRLQAQGFDPDASTLSENLDVSEESVVEMTQRLGGHDLSLDAPLGEDSSSSRMDFLPALGAGIEESLAQQEMGSALRQHLQTILPKLNDKEKEILEHRLLTDSPVTLREIGEKYGITRERVRQIESRLLQKLKTHLSSEIQDFSEDWIEHE